MASTPGYDANRLDDAFAELGDDAGAPLLNRVTQGQYQPGLILQPLILAAAADKGLIRLDQPVEGAGRTVTINGDVLSCASRPPEAATWADVLAHRCPAPMRDLAEALGVEGLEAAFAAFGLDRRPLLELDTATVPGAPLANPRLAGIGQEHLSVTPLQVALAMAALAGGGAVPQAQLGQAVRDEGGSWQPWRLPDGSGTAISSAAARAVREALPQEGGILEFSPVVLSGPDGSTNAWYVGMRAGENEDYVAVVVLEDSAEQGEAQAVGRSLLETARRP
jgi:cell division protein FtsI/penicillin-binding protein 2